MFLLHPRRYHILRGWFLVFFQAEKYTVFLCCLVLTAILSGKITGSQIMLDSRQYLSISDILRVSGAYSFDLNWLNGVEKAASVTPWMARNYVRIGEFSISERGGETLYFRALKNGMTDEEYRGSFYVWSPIQFRPLVSRLTGYTDRDMQRGGRASALNRERSDFTDSDYRHISAGDPESAIAYYNKTYALKNRIRRMMGNDMAATGEYLLQGEVNRRVDGRLKEMAVKMILESPVLHLRATIPFLYRGIWGIAGLGRMGPVLTLRPTTVPGNEEVNDTPPALAVLWLFMFLAFLSSLCGLFVYGIWKDGAYAAMLLPSFSLMGCLAFLTHNLPRYNLPVFPVALVSLMVCSLLLFRRLVRVFAGQRSMTD